MIRISEDLFIGRGNKRIVYQHPEDSTRCLKVLNPNNTPDKVRRRRGGIKRWWPVRYFDDNFLEWREYRRILASVPKLAHCLPVMDGIVETDRGPALQEELLRDHDGRVSRTLRKFLNQHADDPPQAARLRTALHDFVDLLDSSPVRVRDLTARNSVAQDLGDHLRIVIIDGLGTFGFGLALTLIPSLARQRMKSKVNRFVRRLRFEI